MSSASRRAAFAAAKSSRSTWSAASQPKRFGEIGMILPQDLALEGQHRLGGGDRLGGLPRGAELPALLPEAICVPSEPPPSRPPPRLGRRPARA